MPVLEDAIYDRLTSDHAGTAALISTRCFAMVKPQNEKRTCVVYQKISGVRVIVGGSDSGLAHPRFQFRLIAPSYSAVKALAIQVTAALSRWSGTLQSQTIQGSFPLNEFDGPTEPTADGKGKLYSVLMDFEIWHAE